MAFAFVFVQINFSKTHILRGYLHIFVFLDVFEGFFEGKLDRRSEFHLLIRAGSTYVGEFFGFGYIDHHIPTTGVFSDYLSGIDILSWEDKEAPSVLELIQGIRNGSTLFHRDERSVDTPWYFPFEGLKLQEAVAVRI